MIGRSSTPEGRIGVSGWLPAGRMLEGKRGRKSCKSSFEHRKSIKASLPPLPARVTVKTKDTEQEENCCGRKQTQHGKGLD